MQNRNKAQAAVETAISKFYSPSRPMPIGEDKDQVIHIAVSILMQRDFGFPGGGFVQAVMDNDLEAAISRADSVCRTHLDFLIYCKKYVNN